MTYRYIFLIGSAKSGTTKLAEMLDLNPNICLCSPKEPNYFTKRIFSTKNEEWYESLFIDKSSPVRLDASTSYTAGWNKSSEETAARISAFSPNADLIYLVREPIKRSWSSYWHSVRTGVEKRNSYDAFSDNNSQHIQASLYHQRLLDYRKYFPRKNIHIVFFEEFVSAPDAITNILLKKLGLNCVEFSPTEESKGVNQSFQWSNGFGIIRHIPLKYLKLLNSFLKWVLPDRLHKSMKSVISKPIPKIPIALEELIRKQVEDDYKNFQNELVQYGIRLN